LLTQFVTAVLLQDSRETLHVTKCGIRMSWLRSWAKDVEQKLGHDATTGEVCAQIVSMCPEIGA